MVILSSSRLLKKTHMPIALSLVEGCTQSPRCNIQTGRGRSRPSPTGRFFTRLASEIFLSGLQIAFFNNLLARHEITEIGKALDHGPRRAPRRVRI